MGRELLNVKKEDEIKLLDWAFKENLHAIQCVEILANSSQTLDDLWDKDKEVSGEQCVSMVLSLIVDLIRNPFYQAHQAAMTRIIERSIMQWIEANDIERDGNETDLRVSYIIRSSITDAIIEMAYLLGDRNWGREVAKVLRKTIYSDNESFEQYLTEHRGV